MKQRPLFGRKKIVGVTDWTLLTIFDTVIIRYYIEGRAFYGCVLSFDGNADDVNSYVWCDKGRVKVDSATRRRLLLEE